jgi:hypothetical protein
MDPMDELEKLIERRNAGELTPEEFEKLKRELTRAAVPPTQTIEVNVKQKRSLGCFGIGCVSIIVVIGLLWFIGSMSSNTSTDDENVAGSSSSENSTSAKPVPHVIDSPEYLRQALVQELGADTNMDVPRAIKVELTSDKETFITLVMNDNFSNSMARGYAYQEIEKALTITRKSTFANDMTITFTTELTDKYGKSLGQVNVLTVWFDKVAFKSIVAENLVGEEMWSQAATSVFIHPALRD